MRFILAEGIVLLASRRFLKTGEVVSFVPSVSPT